MHITHIVAHPPFREGTGTVAYYNARGLLELGCDVTVYVPDRHLQKRDYQLEHYHFLPTVSAIGNAYLTPGILSIEDTDLIHLHYPYIFGSELATLKHFLSKFPIIVTYHNDLIGGGIRRPAFYFYNRLIVPLVLSQSKTIIVTSYDYAASSIYNSSIFLKRKKDLVEISNGVDVEQFKPGIDASFVSQKHQLPNGIPILLFVSSLDRSHIRKGLDLLLDSVSSLDNNPFCLLVVGEGDMRSYYENKAHELNIQQRVIFAGRVPQSELPAYYSMSDLVVVPSRPPEAFGLALAQGMAAGKPVIGSNIPGVRSLVEDGVHGYLIEPGDKTMLADRIAYLIANRGIGQEMGERGRQLIHSKYTWRRSCEQLLVVYNAILQKS